MKMIPVCEPVLGKEELENVVEAVKTGWISSKGKFVDDFENQFADYCGAKYGFATTNGTAALHLSMLAHGVGRGDEVIVPDFTMIASANAVVYTGAKPVWIDSETETWNIDISKIEERITGRTKAIMPVHIYGHPVNMGPLMKIAKENDLIVIEDAAEAHGAEYRGRKVGCLGNSGCFSFYANKIITTGEGGMFVTNDSEAAGEARRFKDLYFDDERRYIHEKIGFNFRMTNMQAAIGLAQLHKIDRLVETKRKIGKTYNSLLSDVEGITTPPEAKWAKNVYWMYSILVEDDFGVDRDTLKKELYRKGIDTRFTFTPMHSQPCFKGIADPGSDKDFPVSVELSRKGLYLPSGMNLTEDQIKYICDAIRKLGR